MTSPAVPPAVCYPGVLARSLGGNVTSVARPAVRARAVMAPYPTQTHSTFSPAGGGPHELRRNDPPRVRPGDGEHAEGAGACSREQAGLASPSQVPHDRLERQPPRRDSGLG